MEDLEEGFSILLPLLDLEVPADDEEGPEPVVLVTTWRRNWVWRVHDQRARTMILVKSEETLAEYKLYLMKLTVCKFGFGSIKSSLNQLRFATQLLSVKYPSRSVESRTQS